MPESPKFLMTAGRNDKALSVFKKVYSFNSGAPAERFPVKQLIDETEQVEKGTKTNKEKIMEGVKQLSPLIRPPYLVLFAMTCLIQTGFVSG